MTEPGTSQLFRLPEYEAAFGSFFYSAIRSLGAAKDPTFGSIPRARSGRRYWPRNTVPGPEPLDAEPMLIESSLEVAREEIESGDTEVLLEKIDRASDQYVASVMPQIFAAISRSSEAVGTHLDAGGKPFTADLLAEALERMEIDFDDDGNARLPTLYVGEGTKLPESDEKGQRKVDDVIARKREQFLAQRRSRQLPRHPLRD